MQQQEEVKYRKAHKAHTTDEPHVKSMPPPSTSYTEHGKMPTERTMKGREQRAKQRAKSKEQKGAGHTSSSTKVTSQPKASPMKHRLPKSTMQMETDQTSMWPPQARLAHRSDSHQSQHDSYQYDHQHPHERDQSHHQDGDSRHSPDHDQPGTAPHHGTQSEQTCQVHSTGFYQQGHHHTFGHSWPNLTDYIGSLHLDAEVQRNLEALKNSPPKQEFKTPLPPALPMDAYNIAIGLINSWMAYPQYTPFLLLPNTNGIYCIFPKYHSETNHPVLMLHCHDLLSMLTFAPLVTLATYGSSIRPSNFGSTANPIARNQPLSPPPMGTYTLSTPHRADADCYSSPQHQSQIMIPTIPTAITIPPVMRTTTIITTTRIPHNQTIAIMATMDQSPIFFTALVATEIERCFTFTTTLGLT
uniref:Uncharacterized protein n=1 Tax=Romanomermis culicivorax TaxID=13658 RepID=A0A915IXM3_ROMCU